MDLWGPKHWRADILSWINSIIRTLCTWLDYLYTIGWYTVHTISCYTSKSYAAISQHISLLVLYFPSSALPLTPLQSPGNWTTKLSRMDWNLPTPASPPDYFPTYYRLHILFTLISAVLPTWYTSLATRCLAWWVSQTVQINSAADTADDTLRDTKANIHLWPL
jgi:hypothetical protein